MRFLFVYQDYSAQAQQLLDQVGVTDVRLIVVTKKSINSPTPEEFHLLAEYKGAEAAACEINRKYRKAAEPFVKFCHEPKKFRFEDQPLREWLRGKAVATTVYGKPSDAFLEEKGKTALLVLHDDALVRADDIAKVRWPFATNSAKLLARYANGDQLGPMRNWKDEYGVDFAANGRVVFKYRVTCGNELKEGQTEWHLKQGDNTTAEGAARVYFERIVFRSGARIIVFYVGPHPDDGTYIVNCTAS